MADFEAKLTDLSRKRTISNQNVRFNWKNEKNSSRFQMNMFSILKSTIFNFEQKWPNSKQNFRFQAENRQFSMKNVLFKSKTKMFSKNIKK